MKIGVSGDVWRKSDDNDWQVRVKVFSVCLVLQKINYMRELASHSCRFARKSVEEQG